MSDNEMIDFVAEQGPDGEEQLISDNEIIDLMTRQGPDGEEQPIWDWDEQVVYPESIGEEELQKIIKNKIIDFVAEQVVYPDPIGEEELQEITEIEENSRSLPEPPRADVNLDVPFVHQLWDTPDWYNGHWGCGPTSATMVLAYYGLLEPKPITVSWPFEHESDYGWYLANDFTANGRRFNISAKTPDEWVKGFYGTAVANVKNIGWCAVAELGRRGMVPLLNTFLNPINKQVRCIQPSERVAKATIDQGNPVIVSGRPFGLNGHLMVIRGYYYDRRRRATAWIMNDPYGYQSSGSRRYDGGNIVYWWNEIKPKYMYVMA